VAYKDRRVNPILSYINNFLRRLVSKLLLRTFVYDQIGLTPCALNETSRFGAVLVMEEGPPKSACRSRLQTNSCSCKVSLTVVSDECDGLSLKKVR